MERKDPSFAQFEEKAQQLATSLVLADPGDLGSFKKALSEYEEVHGL